MIKEHECCFDLRALTYLIWGFGFWWENEFQGTPRFSRNGTERGKGSLLTGFLLLWDL
jgi:hypothetical protein